MSAQWWCARAWLGGPELTDDVLVETDDLGLVRAVTSGVTAPPDALALTGWVMPGFVNDHSHAFHRALRGRTHQGANSFWSWRDRMYELATFLTPDSYLRLARAVYAEMLEAGYTHVSEFHYLHHDSGGHRYTEQNVMSHALVEAAQQVGIGITVLDTLYLQSSPGRPLESTQARFSDGSVDAWEQRTEEFLAPRGAGAGDSSLLVEHGLAIHSVRAVPPDAIAKATEVAQRRVVALHAHVSEQPRENIECLEHYGLTPVQLFSEAGALSERFTAVHATHLSDNDRLLLRGSRVCMCPTTEAELADGVGPAGLLRDLGSHISLGSDSHAVIDPCEEMKRLEFDQRLDTGQRGTFSPEQLATAGTAGPISVGRRADLVEFNPDSVRLAGTSGLAGITFAASAADVRTVIVAGRERVRSGRHRDIEVRRELQESIAALWEHAL
jgi:formiminoglutamate deiminase